MARRKYRLQDVYDYLLENYGLDWKQYTIHDKYHTRSVRINDYRGDELNVIAIMYKGTERNVLAMSVTNKDLVLFGIPKSPVKWKDYLVQKYYKPQSL